MQGLWMKANDRAVPLLKDKKDGSDLKDTDSMTARGFCRCSCGTPRRDVKILPRERI